MPLDQSAFIDALAAALAKAQALVPPAPKSSQVDVKSAKGSYSYKFADLAEVWETCRGPLTSNGLAVTQATWVRIPPVTCEIAGEAQVVEHRPRNAALVGSTPTAGSRSLRPGAM